MQTITIPKTEYKKILEKQRALQFQVWDLRKKIRRSSSNKDKWDNRELRPAAIKRIEKASREIQEGKGKFFKSAKEAIAFLDSL